MQQLQLTALIEAAAAKETALTAFEQGEPEPAVNDVVNVVQSHLNHLATEWSGEETVLQSVGTAKIPQRPSSDGFSELVATLRLPQTQLPMFDGSPLKYWLFIRAFDSFVGDTPVDSAAKLNRLLQYCSGKALRVIEGCAVMEPQAGYLKARQLLKERFGNDYVISDAWVRKIVEGPAVKAYDKGGLRELADDGNP